MGSSESNSAESRMKGGMVLRNGERAALERQRLIIECLVWLVAVTAAWWWIFAATEQGMPGAIYFASTLSMLAGVRTFIGHGDTRVTATGLFGLSTGMFIGYSGFILAGQNVIDAEWQYLALASGAGLTAQVVTTMLAWRRVRQETRERRWFDPQSANWVASAGLMILMMSATLQIAVPDWQWWAEASAFTAICLLAAGLMLRDGARIFSWSTLVIGGTLILYSEFFHAGTGRLLLVALACAVGVIFAARFQKRVLKVAIVVIVPFALWWMASDRLALEEGLSSGASAGRTGLESMIAPLNVFSLLVEALHEQGFTPSYGYNLLSVPALVIPESIWPSQPHALGYEVVLFDSPELYGDGIFSTVVSSTGEGVYNFGWWGLPIVIVVAACALRLLDRLLLTRLNANPNTILGILGIVFVAMLAGAIADYTWSGFHTYSARMLARLPAFLIVLALAWITVRLDEKNSPVQHFQDALPNDRNVNRGGSRNRAPQRVMRLHDGA